MITEHEVSTNGGVSYHTSAGFSDWLLNQELLDIGFAGSRYTWIRITSSTTFKGARLDRGVCTIEWRELFLEAKVTHLPIIQSDHAPLLVKFNGKMNYKSKGPFRFQAACMTHSEFQKVIQHEWRDRETLNGNVPKLAKALFEWNSSTFENIHKRKRELISRIKGLQRSLSYQPRHCLLKLDSKLRRDLDKVTEQ